MPTLTHKLIAEISLWGMGLDVLGGCYLAYDLLGGKQGPLRTMAESASFIALFFLGYLALLRLKYAIVASAGMGILLVWELRLSPLMMSPQQRHLRIALFGFLRGLVLGLAGATIAGLHFGALFGLLSGIGLYATYTLGFSATDQSKTPTNLSFLNHTVIAAVLRTLAICAAGTLAGLLVSPNAFWVIRGLKLGLAAGLVSFMLGISIPSIRSRIEKMPKERLGIIGIYLILLGILLQSTQYWVTVFEIPIVNG